MTTVYVVVPDGVDDPARPSGGNIYDRHVCAGLAAAGCDVRERSVPGSWPSPDAAAERALAEVVAALPDGALVLIDGLIASAAPTVLVPAGARLRLAVLVHMPFGERAPLAAACAVVTTSRWTRDLLIERYGLVPSRVSVAEPGVDPAPLAAGTAEGTRLICVAAVAPHKGHDALLGALAELADLPWHCTFVGSLDRDPAFVRRMREQADAGGIAGRVEFAGVRRGAELECSYAASDVLVLASRGESYGMVVSEALARGLPVIATAVGGVSEALGSTARGEVPGLLVPAGDAGALAAALRGWLTDAALRVRLRRAAGERRATLPGWARTAELVAAALAAERA